MSILKCQFKNVEKILKDKNVPKQNCNTRFLYFISVSEYINLFGYIQFGGILITPVIGFVFDKSRLTPAKEAMLTIPERRLQSLRECIAPFLLTNLLCLLFCVLSMIEDIRFQVVMKYSVMQVIGRYCFILRSNNFDNEITETFFLLVFCNVFCQTRNLFYRTNSKIYSNKENPIRLKIDFTRYTSNIR